MNYEYTFVIIRPGGIKRRLITYIYTSLMDACLEVEAWKIGMVTKAQLDEHYEHIKTAYPDKYEEMVAEMLSGESLFLLLSGEGAVKKVRDMLGHWNPEIAKGENPYSIRSLYGNPVIFSDNIMHASDSEENALVEFERFFGMDIDCFKDMASEKANEKINEEANFNYMKVLGKVRALYKESVTS